MVRLFGFSISIIGLSSIAIVFGINSLILNGYITHPLVAWLMSLVGPFFYFIFSIMVAGGLIQSIFGVGFIDPPNDFDKPTVSLRQPSVTWTAESDRL